MLGAVYQGRGDYARRGRLPRAAYARLVVGLVIVGPAQPRRVHNDFAVAGGAAPAVAWQHLLMGLDRPARTQIEDPELLQILRLADGRRFLAALAYVLWPVEPLYLEEPTVVRDFAHRADLPVLGTVPLQGAAEVQRMPAAIRNNGIAGDSQVVNVLVRHRHGGRRPINTELANRAGELVRSFLEIYDPVVAGDTEPVLRLLDGVLHVLAVHSSPPHPKAALLFFNRLHDLGRADWPTLLCLRLRCAADSTCASWLAQHSLPDVFLAHSYGAR